MIEKRVVFRYEGVNSMGTLENRAKTRRMVAHQVMLYHVKGPDGNCEVCPEVSPCWARQLAEMVLGAADEDDELEEILERRNLMLDR